MRPAPLHPLAGLLLTAALALVGCGGSHHSRSVTHHGGPGSKTTTTQSSASAFTPAPAALALANKLPLERQVSALFLVSLTGSDPSAVGSLGSTRWGGVVLSSANFAGVPKLMKLVAAIRKAAKAAGAPAPLIAATQEGGSNTAFSGLPPQPESTLGTSGQPSLAQAQALAAGKALRALGVQMNLAPLADVDVPQGVLSGRLFSADPQTVARFTRAAVAGYATAGTIAAVGHFPGAGAASADPDQQSASVGETLPQLRAHDLIPFAAIAASAPVIEMSNSAYVAFDGVTPATLLPRAVDLLRGAYGFRGVVMSDDLDASLQATGSSIGQAAVQALRAGDDLLYLNAPPSELQQAYQALLADVRSSARDRALAHTALLRVLSLESSYGLIH